MEKKIFLIAIIVVYIVFTGTPVSATGTTSSVAQINATLIQLPTLHFNNSQQNVIVNSELSVGQLTGVAQSN